MRVLERGREVSTRRLRRAAFALARMAPVDRDWILAQLSSAERARLSDVVGFANGFDSTAQPDLSATETPTRGQEGIPLDAARRGGSHTEPARLQALEAIAEVPAADWLARALMHAFAPADIARMRQTLRKRLTAETHAAPLTPVAARALAEAVEEAARLVPAHAYARATTVQRLASWLSRGRA